MIRGTQLIDRAFDAGRTPGRLPDYVARSTGCTGGDDGTPETASPEDDANEAPEWERAANERIREHRIADLEVVVHSDGKAVTDADVTVTMSRHDYGFGTAVNASLFHEETKEGDAYRERITELFNTAVLEDCHKWGPWENPENRERADRTVRWLRERGLEVRGHACVWQTDSFDFYQYPDDVGAALEDGDPEYLAERSVDHVETIVDAYAGEMVDWDVVNEQLDHHGLTDVVDPATPVPEKPILVD